MEENALPKNLFNFLKITFKQIEILVEKYNLFMTNIGIMNYVKLMTILKFQKTNIFLLFVIKKLFFRDFI